MQNIAGNIRAALSSKWFLRVVLALFVLQASWIALSAAYPQAFDEDFHFGIIRTYSHQWLPFMGSQPDQADAYGAVARDPSFLYHYTMSFPYRVIHAVTGSVNAQVITLRFINIALFSLGLVLFYRLLRRVGLSRAVSGLAIFIVSFIPVAPQLAGQINYDNMLMPLAAWACLLALSVIEQLRQRKPRVQTLLGLLAVCLAAAMVKYEFMPIFLAIVLFLGWYGYRTLRGHFAAVRHDMGQQLRALSWLKRVGFAVVLIALLGLFMQRDGYNAVRYHTIAPDCAQVLSTRQCSAYSVWIHDYLSHQKVVNHQAYVNHNPLAYLGEWIYWLWYRLFFAVNGPLQSFANYPPLPLPAAAFALLGIGSVIVIVMQRRRLFKGRPELVFLGTVVIIYLLTLLVEGYLKYRKTAVLELMNGRYLFPIMLPAAALAATAFGYALTHHPRVRVVCATLLVICFLQGGGVLTFILRSDSSWYFTNSAVQHANSTARKLAQPVIVEGPTSYGTGRWFFN